MNFLAHLFLSCDSEDLLLGNFLADYVDNATVREYPAPIQDGVQLHRKIDAYTDTHPEVLSGVRRLYDKHGKYAPVVVDVFYDYFLAINWPAYSEQPLAEFTQGVYRILEKHIDMMPPPLQRRLPLMIADDWLQAYGSHNGIDYTFYRMQQRVSRPEYLEGALDSLIRDFEPLNLEFNRFFPDVIGFVKGECLC